MRKIFFVSMVIGICLVNAPAYCENLPESIKETVLKDIGFYKPVEGPTTPVLARFLVSYGYVTDNGPTEKLKKLGPYLREDQGGVLGGIYIGEGSIFYLTLAKRVLKSIDYANKWKLNNLDTWSFTFTYFMEPTLPELPQRGLFTGKGTAMFNPATGKFDTVFEKDVGPRYGSSLGDRGGFEYYEWLEKQPVPSKPESAQLPMVNKPARIVSAEEKVPIPEFYGVYLVSDGKLIPTRDASSSITTLTDEMGIPAGIGLKKLSGVSLSPKAYIIIYKKVEGVEELELCYGLRKYKFDNKLQLWRSEIEIPVKIGPVSRQPDLYRVVPISPLTEGVYVFGNIIEGWANFVVGKIPGIQPMPGKDHTELPSQAPIITETPEKITIDSLTRNITDTNYFPEQSKIFDASFDTVCAAANKFLKDYTIDISDSNKGILTTKQMTNFTGDRKEQVFVLIEKMSENSTKVTVKDFYYEYRQYNAPYQYQDGWYRNTYTSATVLSGIEKEIKREVKKQEKQGYLVAADGKQYYFVTVAGKEYKVSGDIFTGKKEGRFFTDDKANIVRDIALTKKIAESAWVYENIVKAPGVPASKRVSAILSTYKALRRYELAQDILARVSVQILAATISGGTTLTYTVPAGLTWRVAHDQLINLKGLLSLTGRQGLEEALTKYQQMESLIAKLKPNQIDETTATEIKTLYDSAYGLDLPYSALLASLMPKRGRELVDKALKDMGDELVMTLPLPDKTISDAVLTNRELFDLQGKMDDALKSIPALKEYYEKLNLAKRLKEANEQVIAVWAEQAVHYKQ